MNFPNVLKKRFHFVIMDYWVEIENDMKIYSRMKFVNS